MIRSISLTNFYSFKDETRLSFEVDKNAPKNESYAESQWGRLSKIQVIIGANASGKTNLMKALPFLKWIIVDSFSSDPNSSIPIDAFAFDVNNSRPSSLDVDFEMGGLVYSYFVELTPERITRETLHVKSKARVRTTTKKLLERIWNNVSQEYDIDSRKYNLPGIKDLLRSNSSMIASAVRINNKLSNEITNYWRRLKTNVRQVGYSDNENNLLTALTAYSKDDILKRKVEKILSRFDLGLSEISILNNKTDNTKKPITAVVLHEIDGEKYTLPIEYESSGTKKLISLLKPILTVLAVGGIAVLDEIDVNLHPDIVNTIITLFTNRHTNPTGAQFLFSTHSHVVLSRLDKYQIVLTQKNKDGKTVSWRLDENQDIVRSDENIYAKYMSGAYGGVPDIEL